MKQRRALAGNHQRIGQRLGQRDDRNGEVIYRLAISLQDGDETVF